VYVVTDTYDKRQKRSEKNELNIILGFKFISGFLELFYPFAISIVRVTRLCHFSV